MTSNDIREKFLQFFESRGHRLIPSASLVPENDESVLFTTAGMQPLVPYLLGQDHPAGKRLVNIQKCVRFQDIDEVGDNTHDTFFEMMGNWSLGDYWKEEAIQWSFELLTSKKEGFGLDPRRLYVTVFGGNEDAPRDDESFKIWKKYISENRIYFLTHNGKKEPNWWETGENGPSGPDTEMFYDITPDGLGDMTREEYLEADEDQKVVEVWNDVFMEYLKEDGKVISKLQRRNVDTGSGLERIVMAVQGKTNIFDTDLFESEMKLLPLTISIKDRRIILDHLRTSVFLLDSGVTPSNKDRGYILRRILRRVFVKEYLNDLPEQLFEKIILNFIDKYKETYPSLIENKNNIINNYFSEWSKFNPILYSVEPTLKKIGRNDLKGEEVFSISSTLGISPEIISAFGYRFNQSDYDEAFKKHQEISRAGAQEKFKGGLARSGEMETKYHTATHLLHQALRDVLGKEVEQKGSNITAERLRFDFAFPRKMTDEEKKKVEEIVNEEIKSDLAVHKVTMKKEDAEKTGALHFFGNKYGDEVNVYYIGDSLEDAYSKEFCGGPHVAHTGVLGHFKIQKEEAVSSGIRRIKAILE